jgi:PAS domain S-box-containing protein
MDELMISDEARRVAALKAYGVLDTSPEAAFDRLTALASNLFSAPIALVSLVDEERQWFKSKRGLDACSTSRDVAFCAHAIAMGPNAIMVVEDATLDPRFCNNPLVTGAPGIRSYVGATLTTSDGFNLGTLCVIDTKPRRRPRSIKINQLKMLAQIAVDALELGRVNRLMSEKQRLLKMAEQISGVGHWRVELATNSLVWSAGVYAIHGVDRTSFDPSLNDALAFFDPEDRLTIAAQMADAIATKSGYEFQVRLTRGDGQVRTVVSHAVCELDSHGAVTALFGVFQDITDQELALQAIQASEARYRLLAENATDMISEFALDGSITFITPACRAVLGYAPEALIGHSIMAFVHPGDLDGLMTRYLAFLNAPVDQDAPTLQYRVKRKDGAWVWLEGRPRIIRDPVTGAPVSLQDVVRDISARKLAEGELRQAQADSEAACLVKSEFLANMSHELRTPLTAVLGFTRLIESQPELSETTRLYTHRAASAGKALLATVNDILDFSKLEAGQVEIRPVAVSPGQLALEALDLFILQAEEKGLRLEARGIEILPAQVMLDPERVRQVLLNFLGNAVKFTDQGSVSLDVAYDRPTQGLTLSVTDTGPGVLPELHDRLFQRFSQIDGSTTRNHGGTGLGLAICKGLVDAMGGQFGLESHAGQGARFWVNIPAPEALDAAEDVSWEPLLPRGCRVLLADDNASNRELVRAVLRVFDVELHAVNDGQAALNAASSAPYDVILMDLRMPVLDGASAARRIRIEDGPNAAVPILAFSAELGILPEPGVFDGVVPKPLDAGYLVAAIAEAIAGARLDDAA